MNKPAVRFRPVAPLKGGFMSIARITTVTFDSEEAANEASSSYVTNAPGEFPEAQQLLGIKVEGNMLIAVSLYEDKAAMERADDARKKRLGSHEVNHVSLDTKVGSVELNHQN